jgi:hypothetical protein
MLVAAGFACVATVALAAAFGGLAGTDLAFHEWRSALKWLVWCAASSLCGSALVGTLVWFAL